MELRGKAALLTGGKRIGAVVAAQLAQRGVDVALTYSRSRQEAEHIAATVICDGRRAVTLQADLTQPDACAGAVAEGARALGRLDILINMASVYVQRPFDEMGLGDWTAPIDVDLRASYLCARAAVPHMRAQRGGRIVNFSDWVAKSGRPRYRGYLPYYVAKAGVIALTEALALELAPDNILVNAVAPGPILPPPGLDEKEMQGGRGVDSAWPMGGRNRDRQGGPRPARVGFHHG